MKATELRLGNLFYPIDRSKEIHLPIEIAYKICSINYYEVEAVKFDVNPATIQYWSEFNITDLSPITLTKEWLLKLGFVGFGVFQEFVINSNLWISSASGKSVEIICENEHGEITDRASALLPIKYVHSLQNLYFALTGEELTIK